MQYKGYLAILLLLVACVYVPTKEIGLPDTDFLVPGETTRKEAYIRLTAFHYEHKNVIVYSYPETQGYEIVPLRTLGCMAAVQEGIGTKVHYLMLQFDKERILCRSKVLTKHRRIPGGTRSGTLSEYSVTKMVDDWLSEIYDTECEDFPSTE